jgi:thiol-disulfide isomerase/thioredoxin
MIDSDVRGSLPERTLVACLCAEWCTACRAYRAVFEQEASLHPDLRFLWIDIEDSEALLDGIDVENFPTILIGQGPRPAFFGAITPQREVLQRLIAAQQRDSVSGGALEPEVGDLLRRLQDLPG